MNEFLSSKLTKRRVLQTGTHLEEAHQDCYWTSPCITISMHVRKNTQVHGDAPDLSKKINVAHTNFQLESWRGLQINVGSRELP